MRLPSSSLRALPPLLLFALSACAPTPEPAGGPRPDSAAEGSQASDAVTGAATSSAAESGADPAGPVFEDGQAQVVEAFSDPESWIRHDLWVEDRAFPGYRNRAIS